MSLHWRLTDLASVPKVGARVFTTFACGGGSSMGYKLAGWDVVAANDIDEEMERHYKENHRPPWFFRCPISELLEADLPDELYDIDLLDGSPPCSAFSTSGLRERVWGRPKHFREGQAVQVLDDLFFDYLDLAERLRPKILVAENVKGMLVGNAKGYTRLILERMRVLGYKPQLFLANAADFGVPQDRERVFFVALRNDFDAPQLVLNPTVRRHISVREAIGELVSVRDTSPRAVPPSCMRAWHNTVPGQHYEEFFVRDIGKRKYFTHGKVNPSKPCPTLQSAWWARHHWSEPRLFTLDEMIVLSSFPDDYWFRSTHIGGYLMGMSVPPRMMQAVAAAVAEQWLPHVRKT